MLLLLVTEGERQHCKIIRDNVLHGCARPLCGAASVKANEREMQHVPLLSGFQLEGGTRAKAET